MTLMSHPVRDIVICEEKPGVARDAAYRWVALAAAAIKARGSFTVALSGGSTPEQLYALLATPPFEKAIDWARVQVFFGDERCVAPDAPESNYRMAHGSLLSRVPIPSENIHRIPGELADHDAAGRQYEDTLRVAFRSAQDSIPRFDLILLGLGPDGHCASLFPHKTALQENRRLVVPSEPGLAPFVPRITFTFPLINHAANVMFLAAGADKAETVVQVLQGPKDPDSYPSQQVAPTHGELVWLLDAASAGALK